MTTDEVLGWAALSGFSGSVHLLERSWLSRPSDDLAAIAHRSWPAMHEFDQVAFEEVTRPAIDALCSMPDAENLRRATAEMIVLEGA